MLEGDACVKVQLTIPVFLLSYLTRLSSQKKLIHAVPSYKEHLYKERLVDFDKVKERRLVDFQKTKEHFLKANYPKFFF